MRGLLIALEGIDGAGTSTQVQPLARYVRSLGHTVYTTAEPSRGPVGLLLRQALRGAAPLGEEALALLFAADRLEHLEREIVPQLAQGAVVISDRYLLSSYAYQVSKLPLPWIQTVNAHARAPDASLYFRVSQKTAAARRTARGGPPEHFDAAARQQQVSDAYEAALGLPRIGNVCVIDAEAAVDEVTAQLQRCIHTLLPGDP